MSVAKRRREANRRLAEAREYVSKVCKESRMVLSSKPVQKVVEKPKEVVTKVNPIGNIQGFEIKKMEKGFFYPWYLP